MYRNIISKVLYCLIILTVSIGLFKQIYDLNLKNTNTSMYDDTYLVNKQSSDPKRLFLKSWRIIKTKYYDPTLN